MVDTIFCSISFCITSFVFFFLGKKNRFLIPLDPNNFFPHAHCNLFLMVPKIIKKIKTKKADCNLFLHPQVATAGKMHQATLRMQLIDEPYSLHINRIRLPNLFIFIYFEFFIFLINLYLFLDCSMTMNSWSTIQGSSS